MPYTSLKKKILHPQVKDGKKNQVVTDLVFYVEVIPLKLLYHTYYTALVTTHSTG